MLSALCSPDFVAGLAAASTPKALREYIARAPQFIELRREFERAVVTETDIRHFANDLLSAFEPNRIFQHEPALAALAVLLEGRQSDFADEYLQSLAQVQAAELSMARRVAALCLQQRN